MKRELLRVREERTGTTTTTDIISVVTAVTIARPDVARLDVGVAIAITRARAILVEGVYYSRCDAGGERRKVGCSESAGAATRVTITSAASAASTTSVASAALIAATAATSTIAAAGVGARGAGVGQVLS